MIIKPYKKSYSWKTTTFGIMSVIGMALSSYPGNIGLIGRVLQDIGIGLAFYFSRDNDKTSKEILGEK